MIKCFKCGANITDDAVGYFEGNTTALLRTHFATGCGVAKIIKATPTMLMIDNGGGVPPSIFRLS